MREPRERLLDILEAIANIEKYASRGRNAFDQDELFQSWVIRNLQIIGEAARALPEEVRNNAPDIAWSKIIGMRNIVVHDYFGLDLDILWEAVTRDLYPLKQEVKALIHQFEQE